MPPKTFLQSVKQTSRFVRLYIQGYNRRIHGQHGSSANRMEAIQVQSTSDQHDPRIQQTQKWLVKNGMAGLRKPHALPECLSMPCIHRSNPAYSYRLYHTNRSLYTSRGSDSDGKDPDPDPNPNPDLNPNPNTNTNQQPEQSHENPEIYSRPITMRRKSNPSNPSSDNKPQRFNWSTVRANKPHISNNLWVDQTAAVDPWMDAAALESDTRFESRFRKRIQESSERKKPAFRSIHHMDEVGFTETSSSSSSFTRTNANSETTSSTTPIRKIYDKVLALDRDIQQALWLTRVAEPHASQDIDRRACFEAAEHVFKKYRSLCQLCSVEQLELVKTAFGPDIHWLKQEAQQALRDRDPSGFF